MTEEQTIQVTTKDPKKVEAGKRLAEYNRKKREELKEGSKHQTQTSDQPHKDESNPNKSNTDYRMYGVISLITVGGIGYYLYQSKKKKPKRADSSSTKDPQELSKPIITPQASKIPVSNGRVHKTQPNKFEME